MISSVCCCSFTVEGWRVDTTVFLTEKWKVMLFAMLGYVSKLCKSQERMGSSSNSLNSKKKSFILMHFIYGFRALSVVQLLHCKGTSLEQETAHQKPEGLLSL